MLTVHALRRIRITHVAAGAITAHSIPVVPAARVLAQVPAESARVANLRAGHAPRRGCEQRILLAHQPGVLDVDELGQRPDLQPLAGFPDSRQGFDAGDLDDGGGPFVAVLEPVEAVVAAGQEPGTLAEPRCQLQRILHRVGLIQLEVRHHVFGHIGTPTVY